MTAFEEARFGLINWHRRRYCPKGFRPPHVVRRRYEWTYLYAAVEPGTGESVRSYMPGMDGLCLEGFLWRLAQAYADHRIVLVMDDAPSHTSKEIAHPPNMSLLKLPSYSPELNPVERWFQEFRRTLSNRMFESAEAIQEALTEALASYWRTPAILQSLTGYPWWVEAIEALGHQ
ncbi:MAG: IS630 family transposase [Gemmatimonadota bacterium]|nr:IS630 family transposase [Gemmatimonadota bacterium]